MPSSDSSSAWFGRIAADPDASYPRCTAGRRAAPPEDCGGPWGYARMLEILADPQHEEHGDIAEWIGDDWDPEAFDREEINHKLARVGRKKGER